MKKLISLALCVMMLASLFAVNVSAGVTVGSNQFYLVADNFEGDYWDGYTVEKATEVFDEDGESHYEVGEWARGYIQPVIYPDGAYSIEFDSKFMNTKGNVVAVSSYILDKDATVAVADNVASSMDFYIRGDVNPEAKGIDVNKWYSFKITIDASKEIKFNGFHGRLHGDGIKLEWREPGATEWKTAVNDIASYASGENLERDFGGADLKYYVGRNIWQYVNSSDMETDGFGIANLSYLDNVKTRQTKSEFTGVKFAEDEEGYYGYSDVTARPYIQPVDFPENGQYTIEFDSKFQSTVANEDGTYNTQPVILYLLDPDLKEYINSEYMKSSIDFNIMGNIDSEAKGIDPDKWYSFKITIDKSMGISFSNYYWRINGNGLALQWKERGADEWKTAVNAVTTQDYTGSDLKFYAGINYWQYVNKNDMETPGVGFQTYGYMDEFYIGYEEEIPATGVLYSDDFEGVTSSFASGVASVASEDGNGYLALKGDGSSWLGSGQAIATEIPENFILTMDVYMEEDNAQNLVVEYWQSDVATSGVWGQVGITPADVEADNWYRVRIAKIGEGRTFTATLEDLSTGEIKAVNPANTAIGITGYSPGNFMFRGWKNGTVLDWRVDNIILTEAAAASIPAVSYTDTSIYAYVNVDAISEKVTPAIAFYNQDRLVAVDWDTADIVATNGVVVELDAIGEYDAVKVLLWDTFDGKPLFGEAWDITEYLD